MCFTATEGQIDLRRASSELTVQPVDRPKAFLVIRHQRGIYVYIFIICHYIKILYINVVYESHKTCLGHILPQNQKKGIIYYILFDYILENKANF